MNTEGVVALLDACVLFPTPLRDFLLSLAEYLLFQPRWTQRIQEEWVRNVLRTRPDLTQEQLLRTVRMMDTAFPDARVSNYERHMAEFSLPDKKDHHVLAAAIEAKAQVIVTCNIKDFPPHVLAPWNIRALHPDMFAVWLWEREGPELFCEAVAQQRRRLKNPPLSPDQFLRVLKRQGLRRVVTLLQKAQERI